ncbi:hypothetical protein HYFRA_00006648 [Hymenoscyphus fraxineus]|uniref:Aminoglycoside phosphotransferase domain-containing protein n=1 Tax=Hymenoscyphus fraxineus TaxID=746836 RepID=A0A9N9KYE0_9HELO|nr:hypothetical protein HYFRA_00006648 [Hymenoscyphus fraxineus]
MTVFDELLETDGDNEWKAWLELIFASRDEIVNFVAIRRGGHTTGPGEFTKYYKGSFNFCLRINFDDGDPDAIIRFPKPGHTATAWRDEKVTNEVNFINFLKDHTTIPVPRVTSWGLTAESPRGLGPFMIMEFIEGMKLSAFLKTPTESEQDDEILNPEIDDGVLDQIYGQIANYMIQLSRLEFSAIGSISRDEQRKTWDITSRPLTYNMNELATVSGYPIDKFPTEPFTSVRSYLEETADSHILHFHTQRNLASTPEDARRRYIARHRFKQLIPKYCLDDTGPFVPYCDDLQPSNILIDPETLQITGLLDWEFTNAMPAQFSSDPPWWLLLLGPDMWLEDYSLNQFLTLYEPRLEQFLSALEKAEKSDSKIKKEHAGWPPLSQRMRESWESGRFWFDYGIRKSFDIDAVYWEVMNARFDESAGVEMLDEKARGEIDVVVAEKMGQLKVYREECDARFNEKEAGTLR